MTPLITWTQEQFGTQVAVTDGEHQHIFALLNQLHHTVEGGDQQAAAAQLDELIGVVAKHFGTEEQLMQAHGYPRYAEHKAAHDKLVETCLALQKQVRSGEATLSVEATAFVRDWLTNHIPAVDKHYGPFLNEHGVC